MRQIEQIKSQIMLPPQLVNDDDFVGNSYIDTAGFNHLRVLFITGTIDAAVGSKAEGTAPKIEECDTTDGAYTDVTGAALADAVGAGEDDSMFAIDIDLRRTHKRYMQVQTPHAGAGTTGCNLAIIGQLSEGQLSPLDAGGMGLVEHITA